MSMTQLVIGAALGFLLAHGMLLGSRQLAAWLMSAPGQEWIRELIPSQRFAAIGGFGRFAALVLGSAALITVGLWGVVDYLAARSERNVAMTAAFDPATTPAVSDPPSAPESPPVLASVSPVKVSSQLAASGDPADPYADPDFKVQRKAHRGAPSLKEALLLKEETKARTELLKETAQHAQRSQYDCEAADHAGKYVKAGLDVWGFAAWQNKYFPTDSYKGARLPECKDIKNVLDSSPLDLKSAVAQQN
jgi:hypothetical protein